MILKIVILQRGNYMFIGFDSQAQLLDRIMQDMREYFRIRLVSGIACKSPGFQIRSDRNKRRVLAVSHGGITLNEKRMKKQMKEIDNANKKLKNFTILKGTEANIDANGNIDVKNNILKEFDIVLAAIHSGFKNSKEKITKRLIKAMENEHVDIIAHPFGRLLNERPAYEMDFDKILEKAKQTKTILEINCFCDTNPKY